MQKFFVLCIISLMLLMRGDSRSVFLMVSARTAYITSPLDESEGIDRNNIGIEEVGDLDSSSSNFENQQQDEAVDADACSLVNNKSIHALMERICELCHEMSSHEKPNMRAECRADCFQSKSFKRCLKLFKPGRHLMRSRITRRD